MSASSVSSSVTPSRQQLRRLVPAAVIGNTIEFYDFTVYGMLTALVFSKIFFPSFDPFVGSILTFLTFGVGFLSRPLGGIVIGHLGDKYGRKPMLVASLVIMGGATTLMGFLPSYESIGIAAPLLLATLRFVQGLGIGGEWGGAVTMMLEASPKSRRGLFGGFIQTGSGLGLILASTTVTLLALLLTEEQLLTWGWRIPLLFSAVLVLVGLIIRTHIDESQEFQVRKQKNQLSRSPLLDTLRYHWKTVIVAIGMYIGIAAFGFTQGVFFINHLVNAVGVSSATATSANLLANVTYLIFTVLGGWASDKVKRTHAYMFGGACLIPAAFLLFGVAPTTNLWVLFPTMAVIGCLTGIGYGIQASLFFEIFPAHLRYVGISLGFQIATVLGGGLTPTIAAWIAEEASVFAVTYYIVALALLLLICTAMVGRVMQAERRRVERGNHV